MSIEKIESDEELTKALNYADSLMDSVAGSEEEKELDRVCKLIEEYEEKHFGFYSITKRSFIDVYESFWGIREPSVMIVVVKLPNDAFEVIQNFKGNIENKYRYYLEAYDDYMRLKTNPKVRIVKLVLV